MRPSGRRRSTTSSWRNSISFLRAHAGEESLLLDGVHGLLSANAIGPQGEGPEEWLPEMLN